jgi:hypothetical protein
MARYRIYLLTISTCRRTRMFPHSEPAGTGEEVDPGWATGANLLKAT